MSTAAAFVSLGHLPFCPSDISASVPASALYIDDLFLSTAMAFFWNAETFSLTTVGTNTRSGTTLDGGSTFTLSPIAASLADQALIITDCAWYGPAFGNTAFASFPDIRVPRSRVCQPSSIGEMLSISAGNSAGDPTQIVIFRLWLGTDPVNAGKYRIYYFFEVQMALSSPQVLALHWSHVSSVPAGFTALTSGTFAIFGITFLYYCRYRSGAGATATGGTMTSSSTSFTY